MKEEKRITHQELNDALLARRKKVHLGGGQSKIDAQHEKGKQTARERIEKLLDPGSFQEVDTYITHRMTDFGMDDESKKFEGDSVVCGFGKIDGRLVAVYSQDFTVLGGSLSEAHGLKVTKMQDLAVDAGVPIIGIMDSGGARIQEGIWSLGAFAEIFKRNTLSSGVVPQISVMMGPCAGGAVYSPGLQDFIIMTQGTSQMFITGPRVIEAVTREKVDKESLGGALVHSSVSGVSHFATKDEAETIAVTRKLIGYLPSSFKEAPPKVTPTDDPWRADQSLDTMIPINPNEPYDMHEVLAKVFDLGSFMPVHTHFAQNAIVGFARLHGQAVGVIANQPSFMAGALDIDAGDKIARFVRFCDAFNFPLITFVDTPGFMPGVTQEHGGIIRHGAKIVYAFSEATVPKISVVTRKAYGGAYIVMSCKNIGADLAFAWPTAQIAVMGAEGAVNIVHAKTLKNAENADELREELVTEYRDKFSNPYVTARSGHIDDILIPSETRARLIGALELLKNKDVKSPEKRHGNIPL
jgi:propionyl-CoA carboxylase beta chain